MLWGPGLRLQLWAVLLQYGISFTYSVPYFIYMDRIAKKSESCGGVKIGECTVQRLLFASPNQFIKLSLN